MNKQLTEAASARRQKQMELAALQGRGLSLRQCSAALGEPVSTLGRWAKEPSVIQAATNIRAEAQSRTRSLLAETSADAVLRLAQVAASDDDDTATKAANSILAHNVTAQKHDAGEAHTARAIRRFFSLIHEAIDTTVAPAVADDIDAEFQRLLAGADAMVTDVARAVEPEREPEWESLELDDTTPADMNDAQD